MGKMGKWLLIFGLIAVLSIMAFGVSVAAFGVTNGDYGIKIAGYNIPAIGQISIGGIDMGNAGISFIDGTNSVNYDFEKGKEYSVKLDCTGLNDINIQLASCHANIVCAGSEGGSITYKTSTSPVSFTAEIKDGTLSINEKMGLVLFGFGGTGHSELTLELPETLYNSFALELASGKVNSEKMNCDKFKANVASGTVELGIFADDIDINVASGKISLNNFTDKSCDKVAVKAASGHIEMSGFGAESTKVELASGSVYLSGISGELRGDLASGHLDLNYSEWNDDLEIKLLSGKCDVTLPAGSGVKANLKRLSGSMTLDLDGQNAKLTGNSDITVGGANVHEIDGDIASGSITVHN